MWLSVAIAIRIRTAAARELREAGYDVHLLPNKYRRLLDHPFDDFLEAVIDGGDSKKSIRAAVDQVRGIVGRYGGGDIHDGAIGSDYVPFAEAFADAAK